MLFSAQAGRTTYILVPGTLRRTHTHDPQAGTSAPIPAQERPPLSDHSAGAPKEGGVCCVAHKAVVWSASTSEFATARCACTTCPLIFNLACEAFTTCHRLAASLSQAKLKMRGAGRKGATHRRELSWPLRQTHYRCKCYTTGPSFLRCHCGEISQRRPLLRR